METLIKQFFSLVESGEIEIYNEFSLQHELGIFLRDSIDGDKIQFERNVSFFGVHKLDYVKREIDIAIFNCNDHKSVIELKYPRNGQVPESMYGFCKDIMFLEQLVKSCFNKGYFIAVTEDPLFYSGTPKGIYEYFRSNKPIHGKINKPTGKRDDQVTISGNYVANWISVRDRLRYCLIKVI